MWRESQYAALSHGLCFSLVPTLTSLDDGLQALRRKHLWMKILAMNKELLEGVCVCIDWHQLEFQYCGQIGVGSEVNCLGLAPLRIWSNTAW